MKLATGLLSFCIIFNSYSSSLAHNIDQVASKILSETITDRIYENPFKVGLSTKNWKYTEYADGEQFMQDSGFLKGFNIGYQPVIKTQNMGNLEADLSASYVTGGTDYDGGLQGFNSDGDRISIPYSTDSKNSILTTRFMLGKVFSLNNGALLVPKIGFQYRKLKNPELPEDDYDYTREASYKTIPIGISFKKMINTTLTFSSQLLFHTSFSGETYTQTSDVGGVDKTYMQDDGTGYELSLDFALKFGRLKNRELVISPYYSSWKIKDSVKVPIADRPGYVSYEPENVTKSMGLDLSLAL